MSAVATDHLIAPHGGELVSRLGERPQGAERLERLTLTAKEVSDLDMLACGALSPLAGFMNEDDYLRVVEEMRLVNGLVWALPVTLAVNEAPKSDTVALASEDGTLLATLDVESVFSYDARTEAERCFRTTEEAHPGVARIYAQGPLYVAGEVTVFERPRQPFPELALDPAETRRAFAERGWKTIAGFQTRNPIHRAHEYVTKCALEITDGLLVHPLVGETKSDDVPASVRVDCYRALLENYYPQGRTLLSAFPAAMRYGGPREAVWHAICRKNYGCSHFIVGRDHAGVGKYYGTYEAQELVDEIGTAELGIEALKFEHSFFCHACEGMASTKTCPHPDDRRVILSGTKVREMLANGERPPIEFSRPEVADILIAAYRQQA